MVRGNKAPNQLAALPHGWKHGNPSSEGWPMSNPSNDLIPAPNLRPGTAQSGIPPALRVLGLQLAGNLASARLSVLRWPCQFGGYVGEESPVEGVGFEEEKSSCSKRAILALLSCNCFKRFSLSSSRLSLSSDLTLKRSDSCSMS